jgi:hypothetical protein
MPESVARPGSGTRSSAIRSLETSQQWLGDERQERRQLLHLTTWCPMWGGIPHRRSDRRTACPFTVATGPQSVKQG